MKRRTFLQASSMAATALALPLWSCASKKEIGLQLYTLKDIIMDDVKGTLAKVGEIGYTIVEPYGYAGGKIFGMSYAEFVTACKNSGLSIVSCHYSMDALRNGWQQAIDDAATAGQPYMVIPWLPEADRASLDAIKATCEAINQGGELCRKAGITIGYHNHNFEFNTVDGRLLYDVMLEELDPSLVTLEMDIYWVVFAGQDPIQWMNQHPGRFALWHVKDMDKLAREHNSDVGKGSIDFKAIFAQQNEAGMKHYFVEQEYFTGSQIDSIRVAYEYLNNRA